MSWRHQGEWSAPIRASFRGRWPSVHILGQPAHLGLLYVEFERGRLLGSWQDRMLIRSLEGRQLGAATVISEGGIFGGYRALARATNGDAVLAFIRWRTSFLRGTRPPDLYVTSMRAGEDEWAEPVKLLGSLDPDNNPQTAKAAPCSIDVWAESADDISVAYNLALGFGSASDTYLATWKKGGKATVHRLEGWPVRPTFAKGIRPLRLFGLLDGSLVLLYASGSYLNVAHWWYGEVLATSEEQLPGTILDMDIDPEGGLHVVGTSEDAFWYQHGTPAWMGH